MPGMSATISHRASVWLVLLPALVLSGCSTFDSDWRALSFTKESPAPATGILGRWEGSWHSDPSDHTGQLRAIVSQLPAKPGRAAAGAEPAAAGGLYEVRFHALWGWDFVAEYTIEMEVREESGRYAFKGESELGLFFGKYQCEGHIVGDRFFATYRAAGDHGTFEMRRPVKEQK